MNKEQAFWRGFVKAAGNAGSMPQITELLTTPSPIPPAISRAQSPSYITNAAKGFQQNVNPKFNVNKALDNTHITIPNRQSNTELTGYGYQDNDKPGSVFLSAPGSDTNSSANMGILSHEYGHLYDKEYGNRQLTDKLNYSYPHPKEVAASLYARKALGTNYNDEAHQLLSKAYSTYLFGDARQRNPQLPLPKLSLLDSLYQKTNALSGLEKYQERASKWLNTAYTNNLQDIK